MVNRIDVHQIIIQGTLPMLVNKISWKLYSLDQRDLKQINNIFIASVENTVYF